MAAEREAPTLADIAIMAISPVLIMMMVGSLVFFLVEVLYAGQYSERLLYTMFFFVIGTVLIARVAIQVDPARASLYGVALGVVTFLAMSAFVDYPATSPLKTLRPLVNLGLMALIWWSAHKLTWDCTHIDENRDASGRGLLSAAGLNNEESNDDEPAFEVKTEAKPTVDGEKPKGKKRKKKKPDEPSGFSGWVGRWRGYRESQKDKAHTPGVWVIYFSLAALSLFAIGQSLIPADDADRRRATFIQMFFYVGSGLGLLVTTSFLGLRRYLRQRKAKIPATLTAGWLGLGAVLIVIFLALGAFLPRPHSEVPWFGLERASKSDREASRYAQLNDSAGKGEGSEGNETEKGKGSASGKNGEKGGSSGEKGGGGKGQGKASGAKSGKSGGKNGAKSNPDKNNSGDNASEDKETDSKSEDEDKEGKDASGKESQSSSGSKNRSSKSSPPTTQLGSAMQKIAGYIKWVVIVLVIILVIVAIVIGLLRYLAPFTNWARNLLNAIRNWWANLFSWGTKRKAASPRLPEPVKVRRPAPFSSFSNPFITGTDRDASELVEYTFAALDSWAWDRDKGRRLAETPTEFAERLGGKFADMEDNFRLLAASYSRVVYAEGELPGDPTPLLEQIWDQLTHGTTEAVGVE